MEAHDEDVLKSKDKEFSYKGCSIKVRKGEAINQYAEAIVCPTKETLEALGGESSVILKKAGELLAEQTNNYIDQHGRLPEGKTAIFKTGNLNSNYAILASVPSYMETDKYNRRPKVLLHRLCKDILEKVVVKNLGKKRDKLIGSHTDS